MEELKKRIEELEWELKWKDEQITELRKVIAGTVEAVGSWSEIYTPRGVEGKWDINVSSILTKLIHEVGLARKSYASDLFVSWNEVQKKLDNGTMRSEQFVFAIRDSGVDHKEWYELHKDDRNYYLDVWFLDVETTERQIKMILHK